MYDSFNPYETPSSKPKIEFRIKKRNKKNEFGAINSGGAIIIIIFVVLCLTIFGLLSFTTSYADKKLADKNMRYVTDYYKADTDAEAKYAQIFGEIKKALNDKPDSEFDENFVLSALSSSEGVEIWREDEGTVKIQFQTEMNSMQSLFVQIDFTYDSASAKLTKTINMWQVKLTAELEYQEATFNLWNGE